MMWADYIGELKAGKVTFIEETFGFISYSFPEGGTAIYAEDIYIKPESRDGAHAFNLLGKVEAVGKREGKTDIVFTVYVNSPGATQNLRIYLAMGFTVVEAQNGLIWLKRPIKRKAE
jgi:hypothetical protein